MNTPWERGSRLITMARNGMVLPRSVRRGTQIIILPVVLLGLVVVASAQDQVYPEGKPVATKISPDLFVLDNQVVEQQWRASLSLINAPSDLKEVESGQCVRFGVIASGNDKDRLLHSAKLRFEFSLAAAPQTFAAEPPEEVRQVKPEGGDFVTEALAAGGVKNPMLSMASIASSRAKWCMPVDTEGGTATIRATVETSDGKSFSLNPRKIDLNTFDSSRKNVPFKDMSAFVPWLQHYHSAPDPAELLPGLRIVASDDKARLMPNVMVFFVKALKASPAAANDLLRALPNEVRPVQIYSIPLLSEAGYATGPLLTGFKEDERTVISSVHLPDPFDLKPDRALPSRMDMLWAEFFATGRIEPVKAVASMLAWRGDYEKFVEIQKSGQKPTEATESIIRGVVYTAAGWSLNALSRNDGVVADYIDAIRSSPDTAADVKEELANIHTNPAFTKK
jgi:hypothetical protein